MAFVKRRRLSSLLIRSRQLSIKEIAYELGFANPHYFSRLFHKVEGVYPTGFLDRLKQFAGEKQAAPVTGQSEADNAYADFNDRGL